jgi:branched-chain amino acid transport system permease protein
MALTCGLMLAGAGALVEMIYHLQLNASVGPALPFAGMLLDTQERSTWLMALGLFALGLLGFEWLRQRFLPVWATIQSELAAPPKELA